MATRRARSSMNSPSSKWRVAREIADLRVTGRSLSGLKVMSTGIDLKRPVRAEPGPWSAVEVRTAKSFEDQRCRTAAAFITRSRMAHRLHQTRAPKQSRYIVCRDVTVGLHCSKTKCDALYGSA